MDTEKFKKSLSLRIDQIKKMRLSDFRKEFFNIIKRLPDIVHLKQIVFFSFIFAIVTVILFQQGFSDLRKYYSFAKPVNGGTYSEGVVGNIQKLNPIFSLTNPAENDVSTLIFSGLTKINRDGKVVGDLAKSWTVSEDSRIYEFELREGLRWHDGDDLTTDDVVFTIDAIQNPETRSPSASSFGGVLVEKIDDLKVKMTLETALPSFIYSTSIGVLPGHLLAEVQPQNLKLVEFNQAPVGSGPYIFDLLENKKDYTVVSLEANENYHEKRPHIDSIKIRTYKNGSDLLSGYLKKEIQGVSRVSMSNLETAEKLKDIKIFKARTPEYTALFFNEKTDIFKDSNVRSALSGVINKKELAKLFDNEVFLIDGPVLPGQAERLKKEAVVLTAEEAGKLLDEADWILEDGVRKKESNEFTITLYTGDLEEYKMTAVFIKEKWSSLGIKVEIEARSLADLQQNHIRPRNYDTLLFSQNVGSHNDIYPFWNSTGKDDPGLNLSYYENQKVDKYLSIARKALTVEKNTEMLIKAQEIIFEEKPAIFLYSMPYIYGVSKEVKGVDIEKIKTPSDRFLNIPDWYILER